MPSGARVSDVVPEREALLLKITSGENVHAILSSVTVRSVPDLLIQITMMSSPERSVLNSIES